MALAITTEATRDVELLTPDWESLADRISAPPFLRAGWFEAWYRSFGSGGLELLVARAEGRVVGILPILVRRGVVRSPTNWHSPLFDALAEDDAARRELAAALRDRMRHWLDLSMLPLGSTLVTAVEELGLRSTTRIVQRSPYLEPAGDWEEFQSTISKSKRRELRRRERRLAEEGDVAYEVVDDAAALESALEEGFRIEGSDWKVEAGTAILSSPHTTEFYRAIAEWAAARGELQLWFLRLDGRPLAFSFGLEADGVHYSLKSGYEQEYREFSPGILLTQAKLKHAIENRLRYEFLGEGGAHKQMWTDRHHERLRLQAFARTVGGLAGSAAWSYGRPLAKRLRNLRHRGA